jgi:hypothetical protein
MLIGIFLGFPFNIPDFLNEEAYEAAVGLISP